MEFLIGLCVGVFIYILGAIQGYIWGLDRKFARKDKDE